MTPDEKEFNEFFTLIEKEPKLEKTNYEQVKEGLKDAVLGLSNGVYTTIQTHSWGAPIYANSVNPVVQFSPQMEAEIIRIIDKRLNDLRYSVPNGGGGS